MATSKVEEFEPTTEWAHDETFDTLLVFLPGFKKDKLTVQITSSRRLRVMGERQNGDKQSQFRIEIPVPSNLDTDKVSGRFDKGTLYIKFPKVIAPVEPHPKPATAAPEAPKPTSEPQSQRKGQQQKTNAPPIVEKPHKPKQGDTTPKKLEDEKQEKKDSRQKGMEEEKKPKGAEQPDKGEKPDDGAQKRAAEKEKNQKENAADFSKTGPLEKKGAPVKKPSSSKGQEGEERRKRRRKVKMDSGNKKFTGGFLARMQQPRNLMNSIAAVLLVLILGLYLKHAFRSFAGRQLSDLPTPQV